MYAFLEIIVMRSFFVKKMNNKKLLVDYIGKCEELVEAIESNYE